MLRDYALKYYHQQNYNCAETIIRAANEYYNLGITDHDMILVAGFGAGMQTGSTCGTLLSAISILSMKYVEVRAHESADIRPVCQKLTRKFKMEFESTLCREIKPKFFRPEIRCQDTVLTACDILEQVITEYDAEKKTK